MSARAVQDFVSTLESEPDYHYSIEQHVLVVEFINSMYAVVERHARGPVVVHVESGHVYSFGEFKRVFDACGFRVKFSDYIVCDKNIGARWLRHPDRRQVETIEDLNHES